MRLFLLAAVLMASLAASPPASAQGALTPAQRAEVVGLLRDTLRRDPSILRDALAALQADDARKQEGVQAEVLALLAGKLVDPADPVSGNPLGRVTVVEFYDTRCPYCRQMAPIEAELIRLDPRVRIIDKDLPVLGATSELEARALLAAQRQGGYYKLQASILKQASPSNRDSLRAEAERLGLDGGRLLHDIDDPDIKKRLNTAIALADELAIQGTPALVVGDRLLAGAVTLAELQSAVASARHR